VQVVNLNAVVIPWRWRLETETSSEASGGDVIYNIERGR
jgi:hypothetical protein